MKRGIKVILIVLAVLVFVGVVGFFGYKKWFDPHRGVTKVYVDSKPLDSTLTADEVKEDIDYTMKMLRERHPAWLEKKNERVDALEAKYKEELAKLDESGRDSFTVLEEWQIISGLLHVMRDGHTTVGPNIERPLFLDDFAEIKTYGVPTKINGEPTEDVYERFKLYFSYELESFVETHFETNAIIYEPYLRWAEVDTSEGVTYTFDTEDGPKDYHYSFVPYKEVKNNEADESEVDDWVYYKVDRENKIGILTVKECNYNYKYKEVVRNFFVEVEATDTKDIIVDLRGNGGGNSNVANEFISYLGVDKIKGLRCHVRYGFLLFKFDNPTWKIDRKSPAFSGNVYVLTNAKTFSSALDYAMLVRDNGLGVIVGEAAGNSPDSYGDVLDFLTPNSKLHLGIPFQRWFRVDNTQPGDVLAPDYPCDAKDALDKAYELILGERNDD